jgi:hypothetical protein
VLILPPGHSEQVLARRAFTRRERWMIGSVLTTVAALAVVIVVALATSGHTSANGCVHVNLPYSTGGQEFYECGSRARSMCAQVGTPGGLTGAAAHAVAVQCRKAGLPAGA